MSTIKFYSTILSLSFLCIVASFANAQSPDNQQQTPAVIRKSTGALQQSAIHRLEPEYPQAAKAQGISGEVILEVRVDEAGKVISTKPVSGHQLLVEAAIKALKDWRFTPTHLSGVAVQVIGNVAFTFAKDGSVKEGSPTFPVDRNSTGQMVQSVSVETAPPIISDKEAKELYQKIQNTYDIPIRINNPDGVVLEIVKATVKAIKREEQYYASSDTVSSYVTDYAMRGAITLRNRTDKKITGVGFKFTNTVAHHIFFAYPNIAGIQGQGDYQVQISFMIISGNPADLLAEIVGVRFEDGTIGGAFPIPPTVAGNAPMPKDADANGNATRNIQVDTRPKPLNRLRPNYTEQARKNKVSGQVRLRVQVGADGSVKRAHVANALPDGLTEEALRIIKVLQFQPAMLSGTPVDYWIVLEVAFNLR
jgi:TonB family protein